MGKKVWEREIWGMCNLCIWQLRGMGGIEGLVMEGHVWLGVLFKGGMEWSIVLVCKLAGVQKQLYFSTSDNIWNDVELGVFKTWTNAVFAKVLGTDRWAIPGPILLILDFLFLKNRPCFDWYWYECGLYPVESLWKCVGCGRLPKNNYPRERCQYCSVLHSIWWGKNTLQLV